MSRLRHLRRAAIVAALAAIVTLGSSTQAAAQDVIDFKICFDGRDYSQLPAAERPFWTGFCSAIAKLPIGFPEFSFGFRPDDTLTAQISVNGSGTLEIRANLGSVYFDAVGHNDYAPHATLVLRARIDSNGRLIGGAGGGACDGTPDDLDDFCVQGDVINPNPDALVGGAKSGVLLRGKFGVTKGFGFKKAAVIHVECPDGIYDATGHCVTPVPTPYDDFEFYFEGTGGVMFSDINAIYGPNFVMEGFANSVYVPADPFAIGSSFTAPYIWGIASPTVSVAADALLNPCTGRISGSVRDYFAPLSAVPGSAVSITGLSGTSVTIPTDSGTFASTPNLCGDTYTVTVVPPVGYSVYGAGAVAVPLATSSTVVSGINFKLYSSPLNTSAFMTFNQAGWGTKPKGQNAGALLATYFAFVYPTGELAIGLPDTNPDPAKCSPYSIIETGATGIQDFLPQEGKPIPLSSCWIDPPSRLKVQHIKKRMAHHRRLGALAGETLALELNVRFSAYSLTKHGLGELHLATGLLVGKTVDEVLAMANKALGGGGLPAGFKNFDQLEDIVEAINKNYQAGTTDRGYLKP